MDDKTALSFNTIVNFIRDLNSCFGAKQKSLMLYGHLIEKTGLINIDPVKKHIQIFKQFVQINEDGIMNRNKKMLKTTRIVYSDKVAIDLGSILQMCDKEEEAIIWNHLLTISAILNPESQAKQILRELKEKAHTNSGSSGKEGDFLQNIMSKITEHASQQDLLGGESDANPMSMITNLMSSGVFTDIFQSLSTNLNDESMDIGKLMGSMQNMMGEINKMITEKKKETTDSETPEPKQLPVE
jgi:hypothetical protein